MSIKNSFDYYLEQIIKDKPSKTYTFPTSSGKFTITNKKDQENFINIYNTPVQHKGIGNGELAIRWLFNAKENHGGHKSDFIINDSEVEVKSYPSHTSKMTLGKFKSDVTQRYVLNSIFSLYNYQEKFPEFNSEVQFNIDIVKGSYDLYNKNLSKNDKYKELLNFITGSKSSEMAINTMQNLFRNKLELKPGHGNYVVNIIPKDPLSIHVFKIDIKRINKLTYDEWFKNTDIQSSELRLNFSIFN